MPGVKRRPHARQDRFAVSKGFHLAEPLIDTDRFCCFVKITLRIYCLLCVRRVEEEAQIRRADVHGGIAKRGLTISHQTAGVIGVDVCNEYVRDVISFDAYTCKAVQ